MKEIIIWLFVFILFTIAIVQAVEGDSTRLQNYILVGILTVALSFIMQSKGD